MSVSLGGEFSCLSRDSPRHFFFLLSVDGQIFTIVVDVRKQSNSSLGILSNGTGSGFLYKCSIPVYHYDEPTGSPREGNI